MRGWLLAALAALTLVFMPAIARAGPGSCTVTASQINFGTYTGSQVTGTGTITMVCSGGNNNNTIGVLLSYGTTGQNFPGSNSDRFVHNGTSSLAYQIYTDAAHTTIWGDGSGGTSFPNNVAVDYIPPNNPPVTVTLTMFAVLRSGALPVPGEYTDMILVTLHGPNGNPTTTFPVIVNMAPACSISASNLAFGSYNGVLLDGTTTLSATCASGTAFNIGLNAGASTGATVTTRAMTGPASALLHYGLFQNTARSTNWGDTVGTDTVASTGTGAAQTFTVFGRVPAAQFPGAGLYSDTITATLTF